MPKTIDIDSLFFREKVEAEDEALFDVRSKADGPSGSLPLTDEMLRNWPSGDLFGLSQNAGMGWEASRTADEPVLILTTQGGIRAESGEAIALGFHTGHWEVGLLAKAAAEEFKKIGTAPFAAMVSDPCDGRTQGTPGMMDSLAYRNDAAIVLRRLIRSLPRRIAVLGIATCDKGLPAMMLALAGTKTLPGVIVPGGVTLPPADGEDAGKIQTIGARYTRGELSLLEAADLGCRACASPGGGCQFLGTAATSQVVAEALGLALPHSALTPSGQPIWLDLARRSARALLAQEALGLTTRDILTDAALKNAMTVHAAFGGSTNLLLHVPAVAFAAGLRRPTVEDWHAINVETPRLVERLAQWTGRPSHRAHVLGGRSARSLFTSQRTRIDRRIVPDGLRRASRRHLDGWKTSERRKRLRECLFKNDGVDPEDVIMSPDRARARFDAHHRVSEGEPRAGGFGDQEHGDRPERGGLGRGVSQGRSARVSRARRMRSLRSRVKPIDRFKREMFLC